MVSGSLDIAAVNPTADDPLPEVYIDLGATLCDYCNNCDLAVDGSPTNNIFISDLVFIFVLDSVPENNWHNNPFLTSRFSHILGANDLSNISIIFGCRPIWINSLALSVLKLKISLDYESILPILPLSCHANDITSNYGLNKAFIFLLLLFSLSE